MNYSLERVSEPDIEPVTLVEMKRHLRCQEGVEVQDDDITGLIVAAREWVENYTGRALIDQTWCLTVGDIGEGAVQRILLRRSPVIALTKVSSVDAAGVETELTLTDYAVREAGSKWPWFFNAGSETWNPRTLRIEFRAGFVDRSGSPPEDVNLVPVRFKKAMLLWAEALYDRDQFMMELLLKVAEEVIKPERADLQLA
ncbi:MAG: hypothetical protein IH604_15855 [Burkholderiales bacterium]|nr:hypothetical protein [Burkholderiales bacterium]